MPSWTSITKSLNLCVRSVIAGSFALIATLPPIAAYAAPAGQELIVNGGFEGGADGWMWEQWDNKPLPGAVSKENAGQGASSFEMTLPGAPGGRWLAQAITLYQPNQDYVLSFMLKFKDVPDGAARVRLGIDGRGWLTGDDLVRGGGTQDWKTYRFPVSASDLADAKKATLFFYDDHVGDGVIGIDGVSLKPGALSASAAVAGASGGNGILTGDTSKPDISSFTQAEDVLLTFDVEGLQAAGKAVTLDLSIVDEHDRSLETKKIPVQTDASGHWEAKVPAPHRRLGFYRVYAALSNGAQLQASGSRKAGFLTYSVFPDPAKRTDYGERGSRFGMQGGFGPWADEVLPLLGARWVLEGGLEWAKQEPDRTGQFGPEQARAFVDDASVRSSPWHQYTLPTLMRAPKWAVNAETLTYMTGTLTPSGEKAWSDYCRAAARAYTAKYPDRREHVYQITWEPIPPWGFKGTDADLIRIYEIAYRALHEADPLAIVAGPCRGIFNNGDPADTIRLFKLGLGKYLDGYTAHPYYSLTPEMDGMPQAIRTVKDLIRASVGKDLPMFGTEQGASTGEDPSKDLGHAQGLLRQSLITLGEGYRANLAFYICDYRDSGQSGYGYFYTLDKDVPWGPHKISPRPIAPAYAAQSMLIDGCSSAGPIDWLGDKIWGYAFERPDPRRSNAGSPAITTKELLAAYRVLAVWNWGGGSREVSIPTGAAQVRVFDWMGNGRDIKTAAGSVTVTLGPEPVYITGVSPRLWGSSAPKVLTVAQKSQHVYSNDRVSIKGTALMPADAPGKGTVTLETDKALGITTVSQPVSLGTPKPNPFLFDVHIPPATAAGSYTARLILRNAAGSTLSATAVTLDVASPLSADVDAVMSAAGQPGVTVTLTDKQGRGSEGQVDFRLKEILPGADRSNLTMIDLVQDPAKTRDVPGTVRQAAFKVTGRGTQRLTIDLAGAEISPTRRYQALVTVTEQNGTRFSQTMPVDFLSAARAGRPAVIDGDLAEWPSSPAATLSGAKDVVRSPQSYPDGLSAKIRYAWDAKALYIAAEVKDDVFVQNFKGADTWRNDCLQLAFDLDHKRGNDADGVRRTSEIVAALTKDGPEASRNLSYAADKLPVGVMSSQQITLAIRRVGAGGLVYEIAIPWTSLGMAPGRSPKAGDVIGVGVTVNEARTADQGDPTALGIFGGISPDKDPDKQGSLVLQP